MALPFFANRISEHRFDFTYLQLQMQCPEKFRIIRTRVQQLQSGETHHVLRRIRTEVDGGYLASNDGFDKKRQQGAILDVAFELYERSSDAAPLEVMVCPVHVDLEKGVSIVSDGEMGKILRTEFRPIDAHGRRRARRVPALIDSMSNRMVGESFDLMA